MRSKIIYLNKKPNKIISFILFGFSTKTKTKEYQSCTPWKTKIKISYKEVFNYTFIFKTEIISPFPINLNCRCTNWR